MPSFSFNMADFALNYDATEGLRGTNEAYIFGRIRHNSNFYIT